MKGNGWAGLLPNGTWTGMAAQLINNEADLSIAQASMLLMINELKGVSFLHSTSAGQFVALFQQPNRNSDRRLLSSVLSNHTWISCCFTWVAIIGVMYGVLYVRNKLFILDEREESQRISIVFWAFTTATMRGNVRFPLNLYSFLLFIINIPRLVSKQFVRLVSASNKSQFTRNLADSFPLRFLLLQWLLCWTNSKSGDGGVTRKKLPGAVIQ